ncbi:MAG: hypothetical protein KDI44_10570 [Thiothrix sp.]|nr:hypothetical protein [Thiothrix sp.]
MATPPPPGYLTPPGQGYRADSSSRRRDIRQAWRLDPDTGEPRELYHGTSGAFTRFDLNHPDRKDFGWLGSGVYLSTSDAVASEYARRKALRTGDGAKVMPLFAAIKNPYIALPDAKGFLSDASQAQIDAVTNRLKSEGYDGVVFEAHPGTCSLLTSLSCACANVHNVTFRWLSEIFRQNSCGQLLLICHQQPLQEESIHAADTARTRSGAAVLARRAVQNPFTLHPLPVGAAGNDSGPHHVRGGAGDDPAAGKIPGHAV